MIKDAKYEKRSVLEVVLKFVEMVVRYLEIIGNAPAEPPHEVVEGTKPQKPLTPKQAQKWAERDRKRQQRIRDVQIKVTQQVNKITSEMGD